MHNMSHALTAYIGYLYDYTYIWEAVRNPVIKFIISKALQESARALAREHKVDLEKLLKYGDNLVYRFNNQALGDSVKRVGRDPLRKLSQNDRLVGAAELCLKHNIKPVYIISGIAAAGFFDPEEDESAEIIQKKLKNKDYIQVLKEISNLDGNSRNKMLWETVELFFNLFAAKKDLPHILNQAEKIKQKVR